MIYLKGIWVNLRENKKALHINNSGQCRRLCDPFLSGSHKHTTIDENQAWKSKADFHKFSQTKAHSAISNLKRAKALNQSLWRNHSKLL